MQSFEMCLRYMIATILFRLILGESAFSYKDAENWGKHYSKCNGKLQSPMAMDGSTKFYNTLSIKEELKFTDIYKLPKKITVKNTGRTVEIKADWSGKSPSFTGGPLNGTYVFEKTIFRWAQKKWTEYIDDKPADFENISHDMEMQLYFYKEDLKSFKKAESQKDGLAVFKEWLPGEGLESEPFFKDLEKIIHKVQSINSTDVIRPFPLAGFVGGDDPPHFLFHKGSLDYPPCSESVTWFVLEPVIPISKKLLHGFRKIQLDGGDVSNVRPLQPRNKRPVKLVYGNDDIDK